jgi:hypothetical protein
VRNWVIRARGEAQLDSYEPGTLELGTGGGEEIRLRDFWIPCSELMPPDGDSVLVVNVTSDGKYHTIHIGGWDELDKLWRSDHDCSRLNVSHWMPLPGLP